MPRVNIAPSHQPVNGSIEICVSTHIAGSLPPVHRDGVEWCLRLRSPSLLAAPDRAGEVTKPELPFSRTGPSRVRDPRKNVLEEPRPGDSGRVEKPLLALAAFRVGVACFSTTRVPANNQSWPRPC